MYQVFISKELNWIEDMRALEIYSMGSKKNLLENIHTLTYFRQTY